MVFRVPDNRVCYSFTGAFDQVLASMKRDLTPDGWKLIYADDQVATFGRNGRLGVEYAELGKAEPGSADVGERGTKCVVTLPREPKTWLQEKAEELMERFGKRQKLTTVNTFVQGRDVRFTSSHVISGGKVVAELRWRNRSPETVKVQVSDCFLRGYESDEAGPFEKILGPWEVATSSLTFPIAASRGFGSDMIEAHYVFSGSHHWGGAGSMAFPMAAPMTLLTGSGATRMMNVENYSPRMMEIKNLVLLVNGAAKYHASGPLSIAGNDRLRIPIAWSSGKRPVVNVRGLCRISPNRRWIPFANGS